MAGVAILKSLGGDILELRLKSKNVRNNGRARRHVPFVVLLELNKVEVVSATLDLGGTLHCLLGYGEESHSRRQCEGLLTTGEHDIDAKLVHRNRQHGEGGDGVDDEQDFGEFLQHVGELLDWIHAPSRCLVVNEGHDIDVTLGKTLTKELGSDRIPPLDLKLLCLVTTALGDIIPLVGEGSSHAVQDLSFNEVAKRTLHDSPGRGSRNINRTRGLEELLETRLNGSVKFFEVVTAMTDHRLAEGLESFLRNLNGSGAEEFDM